MSSLLDKLRAAQPIRKAEAPARRADGCLIKTADHPCRDFPAMPLSPDTLRLMAAFAAEEHLRPEDLLFLDTETTGLKGGAGTVAFLIGLGRFEGERFVVTQFLMRDYDEEPFVLTPVLEALGRCKAVVTFNGASFDMPLLQTRLIMNRLHQGYEAPPNLDLLHIARRVYKLRVRQCTLGRLEEEVFGTPRVDDLPGSQVPERYFEYIRTRELALLDDILAHNAQDILSMARLLYALAHLHEQPLSAQDQRDLYRSGPASAFARVTTAACGSWPRCAWPTCCAAMAGTTKPPACTSRRGSPDGVGPRYILSWQKSTSTASARPAARLPSLVRACYIVWSALMKAGLTARNTRIWRIGSTG